MITVEEIVKGLTEDTQVVIANLEQVKAIVKSTIDGFAKSIKKRFGELPDKETFLLAVSGYLNKQISTDKITSKIKITNPIIRAFQGFFIETLKLPLIYATVSLIDDQTLSKWFGVNWYIDLKNKI